MTAILAPLQLPVLAASLIINEVLYDPPGPDAGGEFVELLCAQSESCALDGVSLEFVNGDDPGAARVVWNAIDLPPLEAGGRLVVGGAQVPFVHETVELGLQNGPDALRLLRDGTVLDAVAWGELSGIGEGAPAEDPSERALARVPDGMDSDDNARDFAAREPSPGQPNSFGEELLLRAVRLDPAWLPRPGDMHLQIEAEFVGDASSQRGEISVSDESGALATRALEGTRLELAQWSLPLRRAFGNSRLVVVARAGAVMDSLTLDHRVGRARLWLNELMPAPSGDEPEWIELMGTQPLGDWWLRDAASEPRRFTATDVAPLQLVSEDCARLRMSRRLPADLPCAELEGGWIRLNNSVSRGEDFADRVTLLDGTGRVVDEFAYGDEMLPGHSYERVVVGELDGGQWFVSPGEASPGAENPAGQAVLPTRGLRVSPEPFSPDGDGQDDLLHIVLAAEQSPRSASAAIHELAGACVRELGGASNAGGYLRWLWDGRDDRGAPLPWGAYVVVVRAEGDARRWRALCGLGRR